MIDPTQIPQQFRESIWRFFGEHGEQWLDDLPRRISACAEQWGLDGLHLVENLSVNLVGFSTSREYGDVVLKIGVPHPELYSEMKALELYEGRHMCKCYATDKELGAMLLERVLPGHDLTRLDDRERQIDIASHVISALPIPIDEDHGLPRFSDWTDKAFARMRREGKANAMLLEAAAVAEDLLSKLDGSGRARMLLHGDLHHWNVLCDADGTWKVIDPKGVIGVSSLECGRFILNHIEMSTPIEKADCLSHLTKRLAAAIGETPRVVAECALIDFALSRTWTLEEHLSPAQLRETLISIEEDGKIYLSQLSTASHS